jgi:beta-phosphoglucomutase-like phosphatase (HAD superfamily)
MTAYQGLIFDFNGVLWWDNHLQEQSWRQFSAAMRGTPLSDEEMAVHVHGRTNSHTLGYLAGRSLSAGEVEELGEQKESLYRQLCLDLGAAFQLSPGAADLLDWLVAQGIPRTIATASGKRNLDFFVDHLHLDRWFDVPAIVYDDGSRPGKPAPDLYLQAAANLDLAPAQCIVVEDSHSGIQAAHAAGIGYIVALGPASTHSQLAQLEGVREVIDSLERFSRERLASPPVSNLTFRPVTARILPLTTSGKDRKR